MTVKFDLRYFFIDRREEQGMGYRLRVGDEKGGTRYVWRGVVEFSPSDTMIVT